MTAFDLLIVQPGRHGDILACLPIARSVARAGYRVGWVATPEFLPTLQGASYVTPVLWKGFFMDGDKAVRELSHLADTTLNLRMPGDTPASPATDSFVKEMWHKAGVLDYWDKLPLILDNRSIQREGELLKKHGGRDMLLLALDGKSSPLDETLQDAIRRKASEWPGDVVDLTTIRASRIYDLCGLMERAKLMIAVDSALMHLSYATQTPLIGLQSTTWDSWHASAPRKHWVRAVPYSEIISTIGEWF